MDEEKKTGLADAVETGASAAHTIKGAIKAGKAISGAAKGAAAGGPYGAVAGTVWAGRKHIGKIIAVIIILLLLPVLFILMLPGLIFGGLVISADLGLNSGGAVCRDFHVHSFCQRITAFLRGSDRYGSFGLSKSSNCAGMGNCCDSSIAALIGERPTGIAGDLGSDGLGSGLEQGHLICIHREGRLNRDSF